MAGIEALPLSWSKSTARKEKMKVKSEGRERRMGEEKGRWYNYLRDPQPSSLALQLHALFKPPNVKFQTALCGVKFGLFCPLM
jgi:hypothetical protein